MVVRELIGQVSLPPCKNVIPSLSNLPANSVQYLFDFQVSRSAAVGQNS